MKPDTENFWAIPVDDLLARLQVTPAGLSTSEAALRLARQGKNRLEKKHRGSATAWLLLSQFKSPITLLLVISASLSFFLHDATDAAIIFAIILVSAFLGFWQERGAASALDKLLAIVRTTARILRDGHEIEIPVEQVVAGDVALLCAGTKIPGDCRLLDSKDLFINEAALTGETYPVEKSVATLSTEAGLSQRTNCLFFGTPVVSGTAKALVVHTGRQTEFAKVSERLRLRPPETDFERGVRQFGTFLFEVTAVLVVVIFAINVFFHRPVLEAFMFSLALAVGLTPQLLPAIISVNLAHGAKKMAAQQVIVRRLAAIENLGSMDVLCSDKTGTLTEGKVKIHLATNLDGAASEKTLLYAYLNAFYESGFANPIDEAIRRHRSFFVEDYQKLDEVPYDFIRKRLSILLAHAGQRLLVTKGAVDNVISACTLAEDADGKIVELAAVREKIGQSFAAWSQKGYRTLGVAYKHYKEINSAAPLTKEQETGLVFLGFLVLHDPPKSDIVETVKQLVARGVSLKMITGDNRGVAQEVAKQIFVSLPKILTGADLRHLSDEALTRQAASVDVFAEVEPNQKERIILALKKSGHVTGYLGDGINDASALHAADVGISVDQAVDVAKEAADIVLLKRDLGVLARGITEGRRTFANTIKYVFMATSANFGNMFSMAGASLFLAFLPLLPKQILLTNLLTDFPEMTIATDSVDSESLIKPQRWDIGFIRKFMLVFGLLSSLFDFLTFTVLLVLLHANISQFRTGWFLESVISASLVVLVIRSRRSFFKSRPSNYLLIATLSVIGASLLLPFTLLGRVLGFTPIPISTLGLVIAIISLYIFAAEAVKARFYRRLG